jgi:hypothetical protein
MWLAQAAQPAHSWVEGLSYQRLAPVIWKATKQVVSRSSPRCRMGEQLQFWSPDPAASSFFLAALEVSNLLPEAQSHRAQGESQPLLLA